MLSCKGVLRGLTTILVGFFCFNSLMQTVAAGADRGLLGYHQALLCLFSLRLCGVRSTCPSNHFQEAI